MHSSFQPWNPWRPPDACYQRALEIIRGGKRITRRDDPKIRAAVAFLKRLKCCRTEADLHKLRTEIPELFAAFRIYTEAPPLLRSTLEARLLAAETIPDIAPKIGMPAEAVEAFEQTFFDVRSRRGNVDFVGHHVIGRPSNEASESELRAFVTKTIAFFFGAKALDTLLYPQPAKDLTGGGMGAALTLVESIQQFKAVMAVQRLRTDDKLNRREILKAFRRSVNECGCAGLAAGSAPVRIITPPAAPE